MPETTNAAISETAYDSQVYCPFPDSIAKALSFAFTIQTVPSCWRLPDSKA